VRSATPGAPTLDAAGFARLASAWKRDGRTLFVVADTSVRIDQILPGLKPIAQTIAFDSTFLRERIVHRPDDFRNEGYLFTVARVP
jgi:hypothetical protein